MEALIIIVVLYAACGILVVSTFDPMKEVDTDLGRIAKLHKKVLLLLIMGPAYATGLLVIWFTNKISLLLDKFGDWLLTE